MSRVFSRRPGLMLALGLAAGLLVGVGMLVGTLVAVRCQAAPVLPVPETLLHASASHGSESFAMATGTFDETVEAVFLLDFKTGDLQCSVLNTQAAAFTALFKHNVLVDLGVQQGKKPNYAMVTGTAGFPRGGNIQMPAGCLVYVADTNTGNFAAYGIVYNRTAFKAMQRQEGAFRLLGQGTTRAKMETE